MRRKKDNPLAARMGRFDMFPALAISHGGADLLQRPAPYPGQLDDAFAGLGNGLFEQFGIVFFIVGQFDWRRFSRVRAAYCWDMRK